MLDLQTRQNFWGENFKFFLCVIIFVQYVGSHGNFWKFHNICVCVCGGGGVGGRDADGD